MKLQAECVDCILGQAKRVASVIGADEKLSQRIEEKALKMSTAFSFDQTPPEVATPLYEALALLAQKEDLYKEAKSEATKRAQALIPQLEEDIKASDNPLLTAGKLAVAGNVIDLATHVMFDLESEVKSVLETPFGIDHFNELLRSFKHAKNILYLADNAGEHIFDQLFIKTIKAKYPKLHIFYMTRGNAIINDVTLEEAKASGIEKYGEIVSSGVNKPGFIYDEATAEAQALFLKSDIVVAKGMGNYETLTEHSKRPIFHLFKVKCAVVSKSVEQEIGSLICLKR